LLESFAKTKLGGAYFVHVGQRVDPPLLKLTGGRFSTAIGRRVGLLVHTGAKSGARRETPLLYLQDGENVVLVASKAGAVRHPAWFHNLVAHPECEFFAPGLTGRYVAREAEGEERERLWAQANDYYAGYDTYQGRAGERRIPVMILSPVASG
jgi:deazaflavin-dependent oxidoreductase (nitroreductase family)